MVQDLSKKEVLFPSAICLASFIMQPDVRGLITTNALGNSRIGWTFEILNLSSGSGDRDKSIVRN